MNILASISSQDEVNKISPLYEKKCECPFCSHAFTTHKIRSRFIQVEKRDSDFCSYYKDPNLNPLLYYVCVCPACGYSFTEHFNKYFKPESQTIIQEKITSKWENKNLGGKRTYKQAIDSYKLALVCAQVKGEPHITLASLCLRLAWLYRLINMSGNEKRFLELAIEEYKDSYLEGDYIRQEKPMSDVRILYEIGELLRRVKKFDEAVYYFNKVIALRGKTIETGIINLAQEQWKVAREEKKAVSLDSMGVL
ncbi:DUF2225 domain-containing protein [Brevibacillus daliensis]|uniref:DUF2225 domain-containing protein n=1 Tax=Brevibacillus daliensis TaxID=2892995 RepID=UPI001E2E4A2C|nr:DUF2225 domain-containing protein [Brevibacillus daliensis]